MRGAAPADHSHARFALLATLTVGGLLGACVLLPDTMLADPTRFIPWQAATTPSLALNDLAGRRRSLADYRGSVVLLNFWATWCHPCREEMASMRALQQRLAGRRFAILLVNYGEARARVSEFVQRQSLPFVILLDPNRDAPRAWRVRVLPSSFLIDADGRVRFGVIGEIDWSDAEPGNVVEALLR
jgi:peroxiredoxin